VKQTISTLALTAFLISCGNREQNKATAQAKETTTGNPKNVPGTIATTAASYTMTAKLNGKGWTATSMMPPEASGRIIGYNGEYIGLPCSIRYWAVGKK
jgi:hypothetical protein